MSAQETQELLKIPKQFADDLARPFIERGEQAKLITIALMTREHLVMIGEPGTAKSALVRRAAELLNAKFFIYLLTKYTEPSELFGPIDVLALKNGVFKRITEGRLLEAEITFLDEIFNANSGILNTLLSIINERVVYDQTQIHVPLWSLFAASNNIPEDRELQALYDRLLLRDFVKPIDETLWTQMIKKGLELEYNPDKPEKKYSLEQFKKIYQLLPTIDFSNVMQKLPKLLVMAHEKGISISDRRKGKILKIIAANALVSGRTYATEEDLLILKNILANTPDEYNTISTILTETLKTPEKYLHELIEIDNNLMEIQKRLNELNTNSMSSTPILTDLLRSLRATHERVQKMAQDISNEAVNKKANETLQLINSLLEQIAKMLGIIT
jgi:MoxR-like ATPase